MKKSRRNPWIIERWMVKEFDGIDRGVCVEVRHRKTGEWRRNAVRIRSSLMHGSDHGRIKVAKILLRAWVDAGAHVPQGYQFDDVLEGRETIRIG